MSNSGPKEIIKYYTSSKGDTFITIEVNHKTEVNEIIKVILTKVQNLHFDHPILSLKIESKNPYRCIFRKINSEENLNLIISKLKEKGTVSLFLSEENSKMQIPDSPINKDLMVKALSSQFLINSKVEKEGDLYILRNIKDKEKCTFYLDREKLWFKSSKDKNSFTIIPLTDAIVKFINMEQKNENLFELNTMSNSYLLKASNRADMQSWATAIYIVALTVTTNKNIDEIEKNIIYNELKLSHILSKLLNEFLKTSSPFYQILFYNAIRDSELYKQNEELFQIIRKLWSADQEENIEMWKECCLKLIDFSKSGIDPTIIKESPSINRKLIKDVLDKIWTDLEIIRNLIEKEEPLLGNLCAYIIQIYKEGTQYFDNSDFALFLNKHFEDIQTGKEVRAKQVSVSIKGLLSVNTKPNLPSPKKIQRVESGLFF